MVIESGMGSVYKFLTIRTFNASPFYLSPNLFDASGWFGKNGAFRRVFAEVSFAAR